MRKKGLFMVLGGVIMLAVALTSVFTAKVYADYGSSYCDKIKTQLGADSEAYKQQGCAKPADDAAEKITSNVIKALMYIVGVLAVIMIIYGGVQYATSAGDAAKVTRAKNIILYSVVGLIVAILAFVIVNFVVGATQ